MQVRERFENELTSRGLRWQIDPDSGRHLVDINGGRMFISLDNLERDVAANANPDKIGEFVDAIVEAAHARVGDASADQLYWILETSDMAEQAPFRAAVSEGADRVLVHLSSEGNLVSWATADMLSSLDLSYSAAESIAFENLARALSAATLETSDVDGVTLGMIATSLPFKSALILAPNLKAVAGDTLGWPLFAVAPDRDFLYLWDARHRHFAERLGPVVVREFGRAPYPISTEVFQMSDQGARAIGSFSTTK